MTIEITFRNVNLDIDITASNGSDFVQLYSPGTKNAIDLDGYIVDFQARAKIKSVDAFVPPSPDPLLTEQAIDNLNYTAVSAAIVAGKAKILGIYFSDGLTGQKKWKFSVILWNRIIQYSESLLKRLTENSNIIIAHDTVVWAKIEQEEGCTLLSGTDQVSISISAYEEGSIDVSDIANLQQTIYNLRLTNANQEYSFAIPDGAQGYSFKCRADTEAGDAVSDVRFAWESGRVTSNDGYDVLPVTSEENEPYLPPQINKTLYFSSSIPNVVLVIKIWK